jgi:hypothetical protein
MFQRSRFQKAFAFYQNGLRAKTLSYLYEIMRLKNIQSAIPPVLEDRFKNRGLYILSIRGNLSGSFFAGVDRKAGK